MKRKPLERLSEEFLKYADKNAAVCRPEIY